MEYSDQRIEGKTIAGFTDRTSAFLEASSSTAKLPALWRRFFEEHLQESLAGGQPVSVYSAYDSGAEGNFQVMAGIEVEKDRELPGGCVLAEIPPGRYLVFEAQGPMPQTLMQTWAEIEEFFASGTEHRRAFTTDFEIYRGDDQATICIAIE